MPHQDHDGLEKIPKRLYEKELLRLQEELVKMEEWVAAAGMRVVAIFEGRDAAGKGGTIKRITEHMNPRITKHVALAKPTERQTTQWYFQRYVAELPAASTCWGSALRPSTTGSFASARSSSGCWWRMASS